MAWAIALLLNSPTTDAPGKARDHPFCDYGTTPQFPRATTDVIEMVCLGNECGYEIQQQHAMQLADSAPDQRTQVHETGRD